ncbi:hypothetical protein SVIO_103590 [Streptomyces violaceusniger]|uniref:MaoC-like domain-containing protein n=1 Tax=Streptomyces violaceusniger TaxID=68280 RepID=A0A4D4LKC6_STRVO|nr:hypothetical protein SVIO_103590 [Streptomyces violaceusniger]
MSSTPASRIRVTGDAVEAFARASGDHSPLHMDEEYARRTSFGQRVVHGALGVLYALATLPEPDDGQVPVALQARFHAPLFIGQDYIAVTEPGVTEARVRILDGARPLLDVELTYGRRCSGLLSTIDAAPGRRTEAAVHSLDDLAPGALSGVVYDPDEAAYRRLLEFLGISAAYITVEMAGLLGWASYLVGMEAPGRSALASRYAIELVDGDQANQSSARADIAAVDRRFGRVELAARVSGPGLAGRVEAEAMVRAEAPQPEPGRVAEQLGGPGTALGKRVALVVGASRGLGAALTQALVSQGATVYGGFHRSREQAEAVRAGLGEAGARLHLLQGDWSDPQWCAVARERILREQGRLDLLVLSACPPVNALGLDAAAADRVTAYVTDSLALTQGPLVCFAKDIAAAQGWVVAVSSQWVTEPPAGRSHYVTAKAAVEGLMHGAAVEYPSATFLIARPPRLATSLSGGIAGQGAGEPVEPIAAALIRRILDGAEPGQAHLLDSFDHVRADGAGPPERTRHPCPPTGRPRRRGRNGPSRRMGAARAPPWSPRPPSPPTRCCPS